MPGLASPGEMEVTNPFYLHGQDAFSLEGRRVPAHETPPPLTPKPISQVPLLHQGIKGYN
ncbi:Uncharacterized protein FKW44_000608 [Caligus rogercresseyi]|uniref:Uncharacterized protein n=1 Tax=Caligus rogercresseyi TaxID=217165 RepID=A0A7T8QV12_CALRO|nr:Uncharacterized protein FKW44_000608 [Caligus rogercresseyi]